MFGLSTALAEGIAIGAGILLLVMATILGVKIYELSSLRDEYATLQRKNAACEAETAQRGAALDIQTAAVKKAKDDGDAAVAAEKAKGEEARRKAAAKAEAGGYAKAKAQLAAALPTDPALLCPDAQKKNAEFLRARR